MGFLGPSTPDNVEDLLKQFQSPELKTSQRVQAAHQLVNHLHNPAVINEMLASLKQETDLGLLTQVIALLGKKKFYSAVSPLTDLALCQGKSAIQKQLGKKFKTGDEGLKVRVAAVQALGRMEDQRAVLPLLSVLSDQGENYRIRLAVAESLGRLGAPQALNPLINIVHDDDESSHYLKESAVKALGMLGDIRAVDPLLDMLDAKQSLLDKFTFIKEQVIEAIGKIGAGNQRVVDTLLNQLKDDASYIRLAAVESLAEVGDEDIVPQLIQRLYDSSEDVAIAAVNALFQIGDEPLIKEVLATQENLPLFVREELEAYVP